MRQHSPKAIPFKWRYRAAGFDMARRSGAIHHDQTYFTVCGANYRWSVIDDSAKEGCMSITFELPPDVAKRVKAIRDLDQRVAAFLRGRTRGLAQARYSERTRRLLDESREGANKLKEGVGCEELFRRFFELHDRFTSKL